MELSALGMTIPLIPYMARNFGADGLQVGLLMSLYSIIQCLLSPLWGLLSNRLGRKPILLMSLLGTALSYLWFAFAPNLSHLFYSRAMAGAFGVTVGTSFAFIADHTSAHQRSTNMALIGAAFGLGFTMGPLLGALLTQMQSGGLPFSLTAMGAFALCLFGFLICWFFLKEDRKQKNPAASFSFFGSDFFQSLKKPELKGVLLLFFILSFSLTLVEAPLFLLMKDHFHFPQAQASLGFAYIGLVLALTQGGLARRWIPRWGESLVNRLGLLILALGFFALCSPELFVFVGALAVMALGYALSYVCLTGAVSLLAKEQGGTLGLHQSLSSLARILGPALGGFMYRDLSHKAPLIAAGGLAALGLLLSVLFKRWIPSKGKNRGRSDFPEGEDEDFLEIKAFQLKNIIDNQIPFDLYFIAEAGDPVRLPGRLSTAKKIRPKELESLSPTKPVVLLCEDGKLSRTKALSFSKKWPNVFYLKGGLSKSGL